MRGGLPGAKHEGAGARAWPSDACSISLHTGTEVARSPTDVVRFASSRITAGAGMLTPAQSALGVNVSSTAD